MADPQLSVLTKLTEFFSPAHSEASARGPGLFSAPRRLRQGFLPCSPGQWSAAKTSLAQWRPKLPQFWRTRSTCRPSAPAADESRALAFLRELIQTAFAKLHTADNVCDETSDAFSTCTCGQHGVCLAASLREVFPGTGGSAAPAGPRFQLVGITKAVRCSLCLRPGNLRTQIVDTVPDAWPDAGALTRAIQPRQRDIVG